VTASVAALFVLPEQKKEEATLEDVLKRLGELEALIVAQRDGAAPAVNGDASGLLPNPLPEGEGTRVIEEIDAPTS
jgi:hypothetical protein